MPGKVRYNELSENERKKFLGDFYSMIAILKGKDEVKIFFKDLLTLSETVMISRRIQIATMLLEKYSYDQIKKKLKAGNSTISQVEKWLHNGYGGYIKAIENYNKKYKQKEFDPESMTPFSRAWVRKKYPLYYLLDTLVSSRGGNRKSKRK